MAFKDYTYLFFRRTWMLQSLLCGRVMLPIKAPPGHFGRLSDLRGKSCDWSSTNSEGQIIKIGGSPSDNLCNSVSCVAIVVWVMLAASELCLKHSQPVSGPVASRAFGLLYDQFVFTFLSYNVHLDLL